MAAAVRATAVCIVCSSIVLVGCGGGGGGGFPTARLMVFRDWQTAPDNNDDIALYDIQQQQIIVLPGLNSPSREGSPSISGDGRYIVFDSERPHDPGGATDREILLYDREMGALVGLTGINSAQADQDPDISPEGRYIGFESGRVGWDIWLYNRETLGYVPTPNLNSGSVDADPALSNDAGLIAFESNRPESLGGYDVFLYDRNADQMVTLPGLNSTANDQEPDISADGHYIVFQSDRLSGLGGWDVWVYDVWLQQLLSLTAMNSTDDDEAPGISRDGRYIAFQSDRAGTSEDVHLWDREAQRFVDVSPANSPDAEQDPKLN